MNITKGPPQNCKPEIYLEEFRLLVFLHAPGLARLLDDLDAGIFPEPLEVMIAISQGVDYFTEPGPKPVFRDQLVGFCPWVGCSSC